MWYCWKFRIQYSGSGQIARGCLDVCLRVAWQLHRDVENPSLGINLFQGLGIPPTSSNNPFPCDETSRIHSPEDSLKCMGRSSFHFSFSSTHDEMQTSRTVANDTCIRKWMVKKSTLSDIIHFYTAFGTYICSRSWLFANSILA